MFFSCGVCREGIVRSQPWTHQITNHVQARTLARSSDDQPSWENEEEEYLDTRNTTSQSRDEWSCPEFWHFSHLGPRDQQATCRFRFLNLSNCCAGQWATCTTSHAHDPNLDAMVTAEKMASAPSRSRPQVAAEHDPLFKSQNLRCDFVSFSSNLALIWICCWLVREPCHNFFSPN